MMDDLLSISLAAAVPLWIEQLKPLTPDQRIGRTGELAEIIASKGDAILYRSTKRGESAKAFNALAEGLAIGAFQPGGVTFAGQHYCANHAECEAAANAAAEREEVAS